ncbi:MAG TPA: hypothetical protein VMI13_04545 [Solirubrobacteraceae bacterium]|nr:hypothetical protein [Solirubrobacteraceae bacterium]
MVGTGTVELALLPGARELLSQHERELPQRDDLCGAFCGSLALGAAGVGGRGGEPLDQDAVALAAGSVIASAHGSLPHGETGRRDYRLAIPVIDDADISGTTAAGVRDAIEELSEGRLAALPAAGPWSGDTLDALFGVLAAYERPVTLVANVATHHLWGSHPTVTQLLAYLFDGAEEGPGPDWRVGHFVVVAGRAQGPRGSLYAIADTYPALGDRGVHLQPRERLADALERRDMPEGGMLVVVSARDAERTRETIAGLGLREAIWDNGTVVRS